MKAGNGKGKIFSPRLGIYLLFRACANSGLQQADNDGHQKAAIISYLKNIR